MGRVHCYASSRSQPREERGFRAFTREHPLNQILAGCGPDAHPIARVSADGSSGGCHLWYEAWRFLRPLYPDYLAPVQPYVLGD